MNIRREMNHKLLAYESLFNIAEKKQQLKETHAKKTIVKFREKTNPCRRHRGYCR